MVLGMFPSKPISMIETINLSKVFRTRLVETTALNQVNLKIEQGEFIAIMGPSGCGKSTLMNILGFLDTPDEGEYLFMGKPTARLRETERTLMRKGMIGFIFQSFNLIDELTVAENVELPLLALRVKPSERKARLVSVLESLQLLHRKDHYPKQLSGGQQQRTAIARAVITNPALILADEPTGNLDSVNGEQVLRHLEKLNAEGTSVIMVTHSEEHAARAHRTINLFDGKVLAEKRSSSILYQKII